MSWSELSEHELFAKLYEDSPLVKYLDVIDRQLADPSTPFEKTQVLRGERLGILRVAAVVDQLAEREMGPPDTSISDEDRDAHAVERILGRRLQNPRRQRPAAN